MMESGQILQQATYFDTIDNHPPYIPPFQVAGLAPGPVQEENGLDFKWSFGLEPERRRPKEQVFLENNLNNLNDNNNNSQMSSSLELLQPRPVSIGLGLSLDSRRVTSWGESALLGLVGDDFDREFQRQDAEINRYLKLQGDYLRQAILEKLHDKQMQTLSYIEEKVLTKLQEKDAEVEDVKKKNMQLELQMQQLALEADTWQQRAKYNENLINNLKFNLQQVNAPRRDSKEGHGDSEVDDTASCYNARPVDLHLNCRDVDETGEAMICKVCRVNEVCMLLLPCKHLCLCKDCESKLSLCPLCHSSKYVGMEVYR